MYEGSWQGGMKHGSGNERLPSGEILEGIWVRDLKEGEFKLNIEPYKAFYKGDQQIDLESLFKEF